MISLLNSKILLVGDSGFGKTQSVKHLLRQSAAHGRVSVYLPARLCSKGVFDAVKSWLPGFAEDDTFLKSILYTGGLDVYIDGLNEVNLATRQQIDSFARRPGISHLMIVTQPMDWEPPGALDIYRLQPLTRAQLVEFAISRWSVLKDEAKVEQREFETRCGELLRDAALSDTAESLSPQNLLQIQELMRVMRLLSLIILWIVKILRLSVISKLWKAVV
jgi:hypothetical protein